MCVPVAKTALELMQRDSFLGLLNARAAQQEYRHERFNLSASCEVAHKTNWSAH